MPHPTGAASAARPMSRAEVTMTFMRRSAGTPGLLFGLTAVTADLIKKAVPDARDQLRASLLPDPD